jgi:hypothetical protein
LSTICPILAQIPTDQVKLTFFLESLIKHLRAGEHKPSSLLHIK